MKIFRITLLAFVLIAAWACVAWASNTANHTVTVQVNAINELAITGGSVTLTLNTATAGSNPNDVTDATCGLQWTTNEATKKITVQTDQSSPNFTLKSVAISVSGGTAAAQSTLSGAAPHDFVTGISTTLGSCTVRYTGQATAAQGTGSVLHTVTYTITGS
jgi:hypothetical protein